MTKTATSRRGPRPNLYTRDNLIIAGINMFHSVGYSATGIKDIVEAAGVPKGSFYNYFDSKEAFGKEVIDCYFNNAFCDAKRFFDDRNHSPIERLKFYFENRIRVFRENSYDLGCLMGNFCLEIADHSKQIRDRLTFHFKTWCNLIENCILEAQKSQEIKNNSPARLLAEFTLNSWEGCILRMRADKSEKPLYDFIKIIFNNILT